ncbi:Cellulose 1,4-beta-cellobiosidase [Thalassocella blandensis]|nr:Cellulose 1,4-beta-cellobiosidase [Thalassocella blandensis]
MPCLRMHQPTTFAPFFYSILALLLCACSVSQTRFFSSSPHISINQLGYLPKAEKIAVYTHPSRHAIRWELINAETHARVKRGETQAFGLDSSTQQHVHRLDFSEINQPGRYFVQIGNVKSNTFDISKDIYSKLHNDAFHYFYFHRLGSEIEAQYLHSAEHAHPALHEDKALSCFNAWCGKDTEHNVQGSWADAGDFGVYPVNHAFAVWSLVNSYEFSPQQNRSDQLNIPESGNNIPDLLDELRYGAQYLPGMLPTGEGLASHKISSEHWPEFPLNIATENAQTRFLQPPSTASTLAIARISAQLARVFKDYDSDYSQFQWKLAKDALHRASTQTQVLYTENTLDSPGAGDYADNTIQDDWYAALAEALITAQELEDRANAAIYRKRLRKNPYFLTFDHHGSQSWKHVQGSASLSLWLHWDNTGLNFLEKDILKINIMEAARQLMADQDKSGYLSLYNPLPPSSAHPYPIWHWGSNATVTNDMIVIAYAYQITLEHRFLFSFLHALDYLLGRNALNSSFITGYGTQAETDTHDRIAWTAYQKSKTPYPPGWMSGGPMNDPSTCRNESSTPLNQPPALAYAKPGTAPTAWCSKENAVNWNASLYWVSQFAVHAMEALH